MWKSRGYDIASFQVRCWYGGAWTEKLARRLNALQIAFAYGRGSFSMDGDGMARGRKIENVQMPKYPGKAVAWLVPYL